MWDEVLGRGLSQVSSERRKTLRQECLERVMVASRNILFFRKGNHVAPPLSEIPGADSSLASCPKQGQEQLRNPVGNNYQTKCRRKMFSWSCINDWELAGALRENRA